MCMALSEYCESIPISSVFQGGKLMSTCVTFLGLSYIIALKAYHTILAARAYHRLDGSVGMLWVWRRVILIQGRC